ncbi:MAG: hypothetical protein FWF69_01550 [Firmicutes bacterium]|nr:hypothetical protein [Bacillota bacterium]
MKRNVRWLFVVCVLVAMTACAGNALSAELVTYTNPTDGYQIGCPEGWRFLSRDTIDTVLGMVTSGNLSDIDTSTLAQYKAQIEQMDMVIMAGPLNNNINIVYENTVIPFTPSFMVDSVCPSYVAQYKTIFADLEVLDAGSVVTVGDMDFAHMAIQAVASGTEMRIEQYLYPKGTSLYSLTFSSRGGFEMEPVAQEVLASFVPGGE